MKSLKLSCTLSLKSQERIWGYGLYFENNWPLQEFQRADGSKQWQRGDLAYIGALIETPPLYENLTAYENLKVRTTIMGLPDKRIDEVLNIVRLTDTGKKRAGKLSPGMKQRLGIANWTSYRRKSGTAIYGRGKAPPQGGVSDELSESRTSSIQTDGLK